jgi:hypothetical protein
VKLRLLTLMLVGAASAVLAEDCPLLLNQRFQLHYNQWQSNLSSTISTGQAVYEVEASVPVFTYRLGALALNGAVEYNRLSIGSESSSDAGLSRYGARLSLFPYRPFRVYLDYQHSQTPDLFDSGRVKGDTWGAGFTYHSRFLQDVRLSYRHGDSRLGDQREDWGLWKLEANQRMGNTTLRLQSTRQEYNSPATGQNWRLLVANLDSETHFEDKWLLRFRTQAQDTANAQWFDVSATLYGPIGGAWHTLTTATSGTTRAGDLRMGNTFASESVVYQGGRWQAYATGAFSRSEAKPVGQESQLTSASLGGTYSLSADWRLHGDVGNSTMHQTFGTQGLDRRTSTVNIGLARGGDVPELIRHSLFFLSDFSFSRRVREEYPPDFVPSELAQEQFRRRMRQTGSFGFTADVWRIADQTTQGKVDWARVTGQVQTRGALTLYLAGDFKNDLGFAQPGLNTRNSDLMVNGSYRLGVTSLMASLGYSDSHQRLMPTATYGYPWMPGVADGASRHYSAGVTSRLGKVPLGAMLMRFDNSQAPGATTLSTWADLSFRQVSLRVRYEASRMDNGFRSSRIVLDLLRWFDTICTRAW